MCIIIYKPAGRKLFPETIRRSFDNNADGSGFAYVENGTITTQRGFFTLDAFNEAYKPHELKQALLHFRIKTHGDLSEQNCHPHIVTPNMVFAHNGVIFRMPHHKEKSDTLLFNDLLMKNLVRIYGKKIVFDKYFKVLLSEYVGSSKMVFLTNIGQVSIIGEKDGVWDSGCWFSNDSYSREPYQYTESTNSEYMVDDELWNKRTKKKKQKYIYPVPSLPRSDQADDRRSSPAPLNQQRTSTYLPIAIGHYVRLLYEYGALRPQTIGKCMGVYENNNIEVYFPSTRTTARVPVLYLERINIPNNPALLSLEE